MKYRKFLDSLFLGIGTFSIMCILTIVSFNFIKDSRVFSSKTIVPVSNLAKDIGVGSATDISGNIGKTKENYKTFKYIRGATRSEEKETSNSTSTSTKSNPSISKSDNKSDDSTSSRTEGKDIKGVTSSEGTTLDSSQDTRQKFEGNSTVLIKNYTGIEDVGKQMKDTLEISGIAAKVENSEVRGNVSSFILIKKDLDFIKNIENIVRIYSIQKQIDPNSEFDAIIVLGNDFAP